MKTADLLKIIIREKALDTIAPTLNLWGIYVIVVLILVKTMGAAVTTIFGTLGVILWFLQKKEVKEACKQWWSELSIVFHATFIILEAGGIICMYKGLAVIGGFLQKNKK